MQGKWTDLAQKANRPPQVNPAGWAIIFCPFFVTLLFCHYITSKLFYQEIILSRKNQGTIWYPEVI